MAPWRFDDLNVASMWFDADVQRLLPAVAPEVERALVEILDNPLASPRAVIGGEMVYIKRINAALTSNVVVPALLLAYTASQRDHLIRKLALCRAAEVAPDGAASSDEQIYRALERLVEAALRRARDSNH